MKYVRKLLPTPPKVHLGILLLQIYWPCLVWVTPSKIFIFAYLYNRHLSIKNGKIFNFDPNGQNLFQSYKTDLCSCNLHWKNPFGKKRAQTTAHSVQKSHGLIIFGNFSTPSSLGQFVPNSGFELISHAFGTEIGIKNLLGQKHCPTNFYPTWGLSEQNFGDPAQLGRSFPN